MSSLETLSAAWAATLDFMLRHRFLVGGCFVYILLHMLLARLGRIVKDKRQESLARQHAALLEAEQRQREQEERAAEQRRQEEEKRKERERQGFVSVTLQPEVEAFTPAPLLLGGRFRITVEGVYEYRHWGWHAADACYFASPGPNFDHRYRNLSLDGKGVDPCEEDRHVHLYSFPYVGTGQKLCLLLNPPEKQGADTRGALTVEIAPLSAQEQAALDQLDREEQERLAREEAARREAEDKERQQREAALRRKEQARRLAEERRRQEEANQQRRQRELRKQQEDEARRWQEEQRLARVQQTVNDLRLRAQVERAYLLPDYRQNLAKYKTEEVLAGKREFFGEYRAIMGDSQLLSALKDQAPEVLAWLSCRHEVIVLAEQTRVAPPPPPPSKRKLTEEQIRARKAYFITRAAKDKMAEKTALLGALKEYDEDLEQYDLDEDERERLVNEFVGELLADEQDNGKKID